MVIAIAAAEVAIGLAIIVSLFKRRARVDVDEINLLRG
jgi:NADH-quinone oxidoreductase subunit K